jgi:hypothetical protein
LGDGPHCVQAGALLADAIRRILDDLERTPVSLLRACGAAVPVAARLRAENSPRSFGCSQTLLERGHDETRDGHPLGNGWAGIQKETGPPCVHQDRR